MVDTPPARSALDFLDAPEHLSSLLDGRFLRLLLAPARGPLRLVSVGFNLGRAAHEQGARRPGHPRPADLRHRVRGAVRRLPAARDQTFQLLSSRHTTFLVVATPQRDALREAAYFVDRLTEESMPLSGLVLNRVHTDARWTSRPSARWPWPRTSTRPRTRPRSRRCAGTPA